MLLNDTILLPDIIISIVLTMNYYINTNPSFSLMLIIIFLTCLYHDCFVASSTIPVRPSTGRATLIPGQPLHFQCETVGNKNAEFIW